MSACRLCDAPLTQVVADLGATPLANSYLSPEQLHEVEPYYPLLALVCGTCFLVQLEAFATPHDIFSDYAYFSSYSASLLEHSRAFVEMMTARVGLGRGDRVVEIASNDGYLLQYFAAGGLDVLGVEPAANVAREAVKKGIPTDVRFFGSETARALAAEGPRPRLIVANNVLAHTPYLNDFIAGLHLLLAPGGTLSIEVHHLLSLMRNHQFDTIYHEHFQYFSLGTARDALARHGLKVVDAEVIPTQGGSLRVIACHADDNSQSESPRVEALVTEERDAGLRDLGRYSALGENLRRIKLDLLDFLVAARKAGKTVVCYGAAAKGNTLLNYCGIDRDLVVAAVDTNPHKQGLFLPGSRVPIYHPDRVAAIKPDYLLLLPWNLREEIMGQMAHIRDWGGRFVVAVPELQVFS